MGKSKKQKLTEGYHERCTTCESVGIAYTVNGVTTKFGTPFCNFYGVPVACYWRCPECVADQRAAREKAK